MPKILVIDDNLDVLAMTQVALEKEGHTVSVADGGIPGLAKIWQECPDLVLLDYTMPDMNGLAVAKEMRQLYADLPIIFITAHGSLAAKAVTAIHCTTIVPKPFLFTTLSHRVNAMLQKPLLAIKPGP
jgi:DNA-binding response OmpR family regulator